PALSSISPSLMKSSPGITCLSSPDWIVHGHKLRAVGKCRFDLDVVNHLGDAIHHLCTCENLRTGVHEIGDGAAIARAFENEIRDQRNRFGMIQFDAAFEAT